MHEEVTQKIKINPRYSTLFLGLRKNHPNNATVLYPLIFLLRRVIFAILAIFLIALPIVVANTLAIICIGILAFTVVERQWEDPLIMKQHLANEFCLYFILLATLGSALPLNSHESSTLGWSILCFTFLALTLNVIVIAKFAVKQCKRAIKLFRYRLGQRLTYQTKRAT